LSHLVIFIFFFGKTFLKSNTKRGDSFLLACTDHKNPASITFE